MNWDDLIGWSIVAASLTYLVVSAWLRGRWEKPHKH